MYSGQIKSLIFTRYPLAAYDFLSIIKTMYMYKVFELKCTFQDVCSLFKDDQVNANA